MDAKEICSDLEEAVAQIQTSDLPVLLGELERLKGTILVRIVTPQAQEVTEQSKDQGKFLTVSEVVDRFHVTPNGYTDIKRNFLIGNHHAKSYYFPSNHSSSGFRNDAREQSMKTRGLGLVFDVGIPGGFNIIFEVNVIENR